METYMTRKQEVGRKIADLEESLSFEKHQIRMWRPLLGSQGIK